ncbi:hypothetical protein M0R45_021435 [Rubus argutus]|uniref:BHLH domain-containing protein n=1 Tax=Rubus argutus TaxID=59490 RepID=A0AAW1XD35_RUBAR
MVPDLCCIDEPETRKQKSKVAAEGVETDYVRVKARRGQATDSHSLAERARRAKIRMRMKLLQSLVPGCDKITGKAHILDAIIKYVQLLQNQVESLAAKLTFVDLMLFDCEPNPSANPYVLELYPIHPFPDAEPSDSASLLLTEDQRASLVLQDGENFLLDMDDQYRGDIVDQYRGDIVDQPEVGLDNLCTF